MVASDLAGTGLFREVPREAHISGLGSFDDPVAYADWRAINVQALIAGAVSLQGDRLTVKFRVYEKGGKAALKANMQKRKAQAKARKASSTEKD